MQLKGRRFHFEPQPEEFIMFDNVISASLLALIAAVGVAAGTALTRGSEPSAGGSGAKSVLHALASVGSRPLPGHGADQAMPVVVLPEVVVVGRRPTEPQVQRLAAAN
jgi:hypothetical protein